MPRKDGITLIRDLRSQDGEIANVPVVVVSGDTRKLTSEIAEELGVFAVLKKPVQTHEIRNAVSGALGLPIPALPKGADRRRAPRLEMSVTIRVLTDPPSEFTTWDISPYGAYLIADKPLAIGTDSPAEILLPHFEEPLKVHSKVVHVRTQAIGKMPRGFGLNFEHDTPAMSEALFSAFWSPEEA